MPAVFNPDERLILRTEGCIDLLCVVSGYSQVAGGVDQGYRAFDVL